MYKDVVLHGCYRRQDSDLFSLEKKVISGIWTYALILSIIPIPLEAYNSVWDVCWIVPSPLDCSDEECTRGLIANKVEIFYSFVHIWTCMFFSVALMILLFRTVKELEDRSKAYLSRGLRSPKKANAEANGDRRRFALDHPASATKKTSSIEQTSEAFTSKVVTPNPSDDDEPPQSDCESDSENESENGGEAIKTYNQLKVRIAEE